MLELFLRNVDRFDVLVYLKEIIRIIFTFDLRQPPIVIAV